MVYNFSWHARLRGHGGQLKILAFEAGARWLVGTGQSRPFLYLLQAVW